MVWFEPGFVGFENAAEGLGAAVFDGGGDVMDKFGVFNGGFLWGVIRERSGMGIGKGGEILDQRNWRRC